MTKILLDMDIFHPLKDLLGSNFSVLISTFNRDTKEKLDLISSLEQKSDWYEISRNVHSIKGACLNIGAAHSAMLCGELEYHIKTNNISELSDQIQILKSSLMEVIEQLSVYQ